MIKAFLNFFLGVFIITMLTNVSHSSESERASLSGVQTIGVVIELDQPLLEFVSESRLKTVIELPLRQSGIQIAEGEELPDGKLVLSIMALPVGASDRIVSFSASRLLSFYQGARLSRNNNFVLAQTWQRWAVSYWGRQRVTEGAERISREAAEEFVNDFLAAQ